MSDIQNKQLCQISDSGCQLLTETDTKIAEVRCRRPVRRSWAPLRKQRCSIHLRNELARETESIWERNLGLEIEHPRKTLPWADNSCQIALARDTGIVCPSPLDIIGCELESARIWSASPRPKVVTTGRTPDIEITEDSRLKVNTVCACPAEVQTDIL